MFVYAVFYLKYIVIIVMAKDRKRSRSRSREKSPSRRNRDKKRSLSQQSDRMEEEQQDIQPKWKVEQTKVLKVDNCHQIQQAERALIDISIKAGTSVPDQVEFKDNSIFAKYPSVEVSSTIMQFLQQKITINQVPYCINFHPYRQFDLNAIYDWYCDRCDYKNFARRNKCYRCQNQKNEHCKLNYSSTSKPQKTTEDNINLFSLMVRGPIIMDTEEEDLLDLFQQYASVKDIRMIKNRMTDQKKDFAFIEFFTEDDAAIAFKNTTSSDFRIRGEKVSVMYSRNKSDDDYAKPLPYQRRDRRRGKDRKNQGPLQNYYNRQRKLQIQQEKQRPLITLEQLKEKHEQEIKKNLSAPREMTAEQSKRRQAELMAKQWEKEARMQNSIMYVCVVCRRKFKNEQQMKLHETNSQLHHFNMQKYQLSV